MAKSRKKNISLQHAKRQSRRLVVPPVQQSIRPGNDFYGYVNNTWLRKVALPSYESSYGVSEEIEDRIRSQLLGNIRQIVQQEQEPDDGYLRLIRTYFRSGMHANFHDDHFKTFKRLMSSFGCMRGPADVATELGALVATGVPTLLNVRLARDIEDPDQNVLSIDVGYLSLPDTSYYKGDAPGKLETLRAFEKLMAAMGRHLDIDSLERIVAMESHVAAIYDKAIAAQPTMMTGRELRSRFKSVPWNEFWAAYGLGPQWLKMKFLVTSEIWLQWLNRQFQIMPISDWTLWFRTGVLLWAAPLLPGPYDTLYFNFFGRRLRGDLEKMTQELLLYYMGQTLLQVPFSKLYGSCCLASEQQIAARRFARQIQKSAASRIMEVKWLSSKSRVATADKIRAMDMQVAEIDSGHHYHAPKLSELDILFNLAELARASTRRDIHYALHPQLPLPVMDAVYEVNAHYYTSGNRLVIPGGITFWPFFQPERIGWSYGGLGAVIGHEMLHAFDEDGSNYDNKGVYRPWWSKSDMAAYARKTRAIIRLFTSTEFLGRHINGKATLSENIADLGGLAIALDALKRHIAHMSASDRKKEIRDFFLSYAVSWRTKERRKRAIYRLYTDVHAPPELRVNNIVAQLDDWYEAFDVKPGDRLYVDPKDRISIF